MKLAAASGLSPGKMVFLLIWFHGCMTLEGIHPLEGGYLRRKYRRDRRPGLPIESPLIFYPRYLWEMLSKHARLVELIWRMGRIARRLKSDPASKNYTDLSLTPVSDEEFDELEMFSATSGAKAAVDKMRLQDQQRAKVTALT